MEELGWGAMMALVGMGVVFGLLALLMGVLLLLGRLDRPAADEIEGEPAASAPETPTLSLDADGLDEDTIAAIAVAVVKHAELRRQQAAPEARAVAPGSQLFASRWVSIGRGAQNALWRRR